MPRRLPIWRSLLSLFFCLTLALAPAIAEAKAGGSFGGGRSFSSGIGSRGSRTFENNGAQPLNRSITQMPPPLSSSPATSYPAYGGSFFQRHPFLTGIGGGFLLSWLIGGSADAGSISPIASGFGTLFNLLILGLLIWLAVRLFRGRGFSFAGGSGSMPRSVGAAAAPRYRGRDVNVADADLPEFQRVHAQVQDAWSRGDLAGLRPLMTPEMVRYFSEELSRNASQGVRNIVSDVRLLKGDVSESWDEGNAQYATAYLRWSAIDFVARLDRPPTASDAVVSGNPRVPVESEEVWTFVRPRGAGWLLSAIQQV